MKTFLKWAGSKQRLLPELLKRIPEHGTYIEPFVGSGALFFGLQPKRAILADSNKRLMLTYSAVRSRAGKVIELLDRSACDHSPEMFNSLRFTFGTVARSGRTQIAADMIYLNRAGFNGLYRVNSTGIFNVPWGNRPSSCIVNADSIRACSRVLRRCNPKLLTADFGDVMKLARKNAFVYCDPPYLPTSTTSSFTAYTPGGFGLAEHERLRDAAVGAALRGAIVMISNSDRPEILKLYKDRRMFKIERVQGSRSIAASGASRKKATELLITTRKRK